MIKVSLKRSTIPLHCGRSSSVSCEEASEEVGAPACEDFPVKAVSCDNIVVESSYGMWPFYGGLCHSFDPSADQYILVSFSF